MVADYFTKPLQGLLFGMLRDVIMGVTHPSSLLTAEPPPAKERVEKSAVLTAIKNDNITYIADGGANIYFPTSGSMMWGHSYVNMRNS